jgi:general stress protein 26
MDQEIIARAGEIIAKSTVQGGSYNGENCVLALIDLEGYPTASVITPSRADGIKWITFCTDINCNKTKRIAESNRACVCFGTSEYGISLVGEIEIVTDADVKKEMWYQGLEGYWSGADDPNYCVLKFTTKRYNLTVDWKQTAGRL